MFIPSPCLSGGLLSPFKAVYKKITRDRESLRVEVWGFIKLGNNYKGSYRNQARGGVYISPKKMILLED